MTERDIVIAKDEVVHGAKPAKPEFISEQCRREDALEDDEVREFLKASHRLEP